MEILAFVHSNGRTKKQLNGASTQLVKRLVKIWLYPSNPANDHWKDEVVGLLSDVPKSRPFNRFPKKKFILKNTWELDSDRISELICVTKSLFNEYPIEVSNCNVYLALEGYFDWISGELSSKGIAKAYDIRSKIEELRKKHIQ